MIGKHQIPTGKTRGSVPVGPCRVSLGRPGTLRGWSEDVNTLSMETGCGPSSARPPIDGSMNPTECRHRGIRIGSLASGTIEKLAGTPGDLVPTLRTDDAERRRRHSHADRSVGTRFRSTEILWVENPVPYRPSRKRGFFSTMAKVAGIGPRPPGAAGERVRKLRSGPAHSAARPRPAGVAEKNPVRTRSVSSLETRSPAAQGGRGL